MPASRWKVESWGRDSWAMTSTALIWLVVVVGGCRRWGLCDYVVDGCKRGELTGCVGSGLGK